jgi:hypothetical protein
MGSLSGGSKESPQERSDGLEYVSQPDESGIESTGSEHPWSADTESNNVFLPDSSGRLPLLCCLYPRAYAVAAMSLSWEGMFAYAFPPFRFLSPVLHKITGEKCRIIVIAPAWPKQAGFANLLRQRNLNGGNA